MKHKDIKADSKALQQLKMETAQELGAAMLVNIRTSTAFCGEDFDEVYEFPDETTERELDEYCDQLASDRAWDFGTEEEAEEQEVDPEIYGGYEILEEIHRHKIIEEYGDILTP